MLETWVQSLGQEDPLEKEMATHSSILAWKISVDRGAWWATVPRVAESDMTELSWTKQQQISNNWGECKDKHFHSLKSTDWYKPLGKQPKSIKNLKFSTVPKDADSASPLTAIYKTAALHTRQQSSHFLVRLAPSAAFSLV